MFRQDVYLILLLGVAKLTSMLESEFITFQHSVRKIVIQLAKM